MASHLETPRRLIHARAPLRVNDIGGWTDTWFAKEGRVLNLAAAPAVEVEVKVFPNDERKAERVFVSAENYGERFAMDPERPSLDPHGFLQHTIGTFVPPAEWRLEVNIYSPVPAGISTGTSASICVALLGALGRVVGRDVGRDEVVSLAHAVETEKLKQQSGIQDQICASYGGICFIQMPRYPEAGVERLEIADGVREELSRRLLLVYLGRPHSSSAIHEQVIARLESGEDPGQWRQLEAMKRLAGEARDRLLSGDLEAYGRCMSENTECQRALFDGLVSSEADTVIELARRHRASGWKVNGAGGRGGSLTLLAGADDLERHKLAAALNALGGGVRTLPMWLSPSGLAVWDV